LNTYTHILDKLNQFIKKYYTQRLLKGLLLFLTLGLLFFFGIVGVEYAFWLNSSGRLVLLVGFIAVELFLLFVYILTPLFYLIRIRKGIGPKDAALMIGKHFPNVGDKLYNLLDLAEQREKSHLLLASMEQRSKSLGPVPFAQAINLKSALAYSKYLLIPLGVLLVLYISGQWQGFFGSYERVVRYDMAYEPPAPFAFSLLSPNLNAIASEPFEIQVTVNGAVRPDNVYLEMDGKSLLLSEEQGIYSYTLSPPLKSTTFRFKGNEVLSKPYALNALRAPVILDFSMELNYPDYLKKPTETIKSTGNALIPEGTQVTWKLKGQDTESILLQAEDTALAFSANKSGAFQLSKGIFNTLPYAISTSSAEVPSYETLNYTFTVVKDAYPNVKVRQVLDSLNPNMSYYSGEATDDHGVSGIDLVYFEEGMEDQGVTVPISDAGNVISQFYYTYPSGLNLTPGKRYAFYFLVTDNDALHGGKTVKSQVFRQLFLDSNQLKYKDLESQESLIENLDSSLKKAKEQKDRLDELNREQKEKKALSFNDQNQIKDFLKKQERQEALMEKFSRELKENLTKNTQNDEMNQLLQERLERREREAQKNQKLLEELNKIADKINKEELTKKLEELGKQQQNSERSLAQLLELTKRYYVTEKAAQLANELEKLAKEQEALSDLPKGKTATEKEQEALNQAFQELAKSMDELQKDNKDLKKPLDLTIEKEQKEGVEQDQQDALDLLKEQGENKPEDAGKNQENNEGAAKGKQKSAAQKMKQMSEALNNSSQSASGGESMAEDAEMLRQILDNLLIFSFKQEQLFDELSEREEQDVSQYSKTVRNQKELRDLFSHVDDSLFALSLRQAELSEFVNEQVTEVYYNVDKSLESMADGQMGQGVSYQKYVLNAANSLADFLANVMDNMQQSMQMGQGSGNSPNGFQLPDIIKGQGQVSEKMGQGKQGKEGEGEGGQKGEGQEGKEGDSGKSGEQGSTGNGQGQNGEQGQGGEQGDKGNGTSGDGNQEGQSEEELQEIYEIYQEQQRIRQALEEQLQDMINAGDRQLGQKILQQMEDFQNDLLENGITQRTMNKANTIQYELLKLENASLKQGEKKERESTVNTRDFSNPITTKPSLLENYRNEVEILNRQALPLRQNFQNKIKEYFKGNDQP
jgi:hypothetical protein